MRHEVPNADYYRPATLRALADRQVKRKSELVAAVAVELELSEHALAERLPSGESRHQNRVTWALSSLLKAGLVARPARGRYQITGDGLTLNARGLERYSETDLMEWPAWQQYWAEVQQRREVAQSQNDEFALVEANTAAAPPPSRHSAMPGGAAGQAAEDAAEVDPLEQISELAALYSREVETELRRRLQEASPSFFEKAVLDLLWAMGYGGKHGARQLLGQSGDGGIDGMIRQDALGLSKVYVQAKRYADDNKVGRPAIQQFFGSLSSRGADRGVFITTSSFTAEARQEAEVYERTGKRIILIDGLTLTRLMLEYQVGVQPKATHTLYEVDDDFFEGD